MKYALYNKITISEQFETFEFISTGIKGDIEKRVKFEFVTEPGVYNLAFGDINEDGEIDDYIISDNGDMSKILATIAFIVKTFLERYPKRTVTFRGSTEERTRLYRMAIGNNLTELLAFFDIYGVYKNGDSHFFVRNENYSAFQVKKKS